LKRANLGRAGKEMKQIAKRKDKTTTFADKETIRKDFDRLMRNNEAREIYNEEMALFFFVEKLKAELERKHLTKYALAKRAGLNPQVVSQVLKGDNAEIKTLVKLANGVGKQLILKLA
jgi:hypothetical protein